MGRRREVSAPRYCVRLYGRASRPPDLLFNTPFQLSEVYLQARAGSSTSHLSRSNM